MEGHAGWEVSVLGVWGCFFERSEMIFAFVVFFFTAVVAVGAFGAVASIVGSTMSVIRQLVMVLKSSFFFFFFFFSVVLDALGFKNVHLTY